MWFVAILIFVAVFLIAAYSLRHYWISFAHKSQTNRFVAAVDSAIALRLDHEFAARTNILTSSQPFTIHDEPDAALVNKAQKQTLELGRFLSHLAKLMQFQRSLVGTSPQEFCLDEAITHAVRRFSKTHPSHQGEVVLRMPREASHIYTGCKTSLQQLLEFLLEGVWYRGDKGDIILGVEFEQTRQKKRIRLSVSMMTKGNGVGFADELFLPFSNKNISKRGYTGMELTLARHLAYLLKGSLQVKSLEHNGFSIVANIPIAHKMQPPYNAQNDAELNTTVPPVSGKRFLLIDTPASPILALREYLEQWGNQVQVFPTGREAIHQIRSQSSTTLASIYDFLFIDESMEDFDFAVVMHFILSNPNIIDRIVLMARRSPRPSQREPGVHAVLEKPFSRDSLYGTLSALVATPQNSSAKPNLAEQEINPSLPPQIQTFVPALSVHAEDLLAAVPEPQPKQKLRGLVVDDNLVNMHTVAGVLRQRSMEVLVAENGKEALEIFLQNSQTLDFILMDVQMPEMDGCEATKRIRAFERERATRIPIIALTAFAKKEDRKRCLEAGMDDFISKGATPEALFEKIGSLLTHQNTVVSREISKSTNTN